MPLITLDLPDPKQLRPGWAALAAVYASRGWNDLAYAAGNEWLYNDGGGNWACLRFIADERIILFGHDHEYSDTYFADAAEYFEEEETDLLDGAPDWWRDAISAPYGDWIGFIYGWNGKIWQRADYEKNDGFESVGLIAACVTSVYDHIAEAAKDASEPDFEAIHALVSADANITSAQLEAVVSGWDIEAGVLAARKFLDVQAK